MADNLEFGKLTLQADTYIKVLNAGNDKFAIYYIDQNLNRVTVGLESGTIQLPAAEAFIPGKEFRKILQSLQTEIFIDDLAADFNELFFTLIKYALVEQKNLDWVFKTSFISATQYIRKLEQFASYISDNQDFYQSYINEVKPYRTILREFNINYQRNDEFGGDITDFDLAPYWDSNINVYRSPSGEQSYDTGLLNNRVYYDWKNNYAYGVVDIIVGAGGSGYVTAPQIIISGGGGTGANAVAQINGLGQLANVTVVSAGTGYTSSPRIIINGTGTDAVATAVLRNVFDGNDTGHNVVRSIKTNIKFDRLTYDIKRPTQWANTIAESTGLTNANAAVMWDEVVSGQVIAANTVINLGGELYQLSIFPHTVSANVDFPLANVSSINASILPTSNDRIVAYNGNIDLRASAEGIDYPGIIVDGSTYFAYDTVPEWTANTDIATDTQISHSGNVYIVTGNVYAGYFANIVSNVTQVSGEKIDAIIQSRFADNLGLDSGNIYVDGGEYVDRFSSHAPEELIPGHMFDSLNLKVFSNTAPATNDYAFRLVDNMSEDHSFYRISNAYTTTLSRDLLITDDRIFVTDGTRLPNPNRDAGIPGVVFVNGEKITYYRNYAQETITSWAANTTTNVIPADTLTSFNGNIYLTLGNVYAPNTPWSANTTFAVNSYVYYSGNSYQITGNVNAPYFANIAANTALIYNNENSGFATISSNVTLVANTANVLGQIRRATDGTAPNSLNTVPWSANLVLPTGTYITYNSNTYVTTGNVYGFSIPWRPNVGLVANTYFFYGSNVYQVSSNVGANVYGSSFANVSANANVKYTGRIDSGYVSIQSNVQLLYTGTNNVRHLANTRVVDASEQQTIPDITVSNTSIAATTAINTTANVTLRLRLNGNITANIGDYILTNIANLRLLETVTTASNIAVLPHTGNIFAGNANAISIVSRITGNATSTATTVMYANVLGQVSSVGNVTVLANTYVTRSNIWYGNVTNTFYGNTLANSTTAQGSFLTASPGYIP